jgi:hypothetical protein
MPRMADGRGMLYLPAPGDSVTPAATRLPLAGARYSVPSSKDAYDLEPPYGIEPVDLLLTMHRRAVP